jgi:hypothetical protein
MKILSCEHGDCYTRSGDEETDDVCVDCRFKRYHQRGGRLSPLDFMMLLGHRGLLRELFAWFAELNEPKSFVEQLTFKGMCNMLEGMYITKMWIARREGEWVVMLATRHMISTPYEGRHSDILTAINEALDQYIKEICSVNGITPSQIRSELIAV